MTTIIEMAVQDEGNYYDRFSTNGIDFRHDNNDSYSSGETSLSINLLEYIQGEDENSMVIDLINKGDDDDESEMRLIAMR